MASTPRELLYEELVQWIIIQKRERMKYLISYEDFNSLKDAYLNDPKFTFKGQDKNAAWLKDSRTQDAITGMKDAWQGMQAATASLECIQLQIREAQEINYAMVRLRQKKAAFGLNR